MLCHIMQLYGTEVSDPHSHRGASSGALDAVSSVQSAGATLQ